MMSTDRLKNLHRLETNQRKFMCIMNDVAKMPQSKYAGSIDREKQESAQTSDKDIARTRKTLVRKKVLKKCMQEKREEVEKQQANKLFGRYQGETAEQIAGQIDTVIENNHPKLRRMKKIDVMFKTAYEKGAIMNNETMKDKVRDYFNRPLIHLQHLDSGEMSSDDERDSLSKTIPPFSKSFYTGQMERHVHNTHDFHQERYETIAEMPETEDWMEESDDNEHSGKLFVKRKPHHFVTDEVRDTLSVQSEAPKTTVMSTRHKEVRPITLPTVKPERDNTIPIPESEKPRSDCISELIDRIHRAKDTRDREKKIRKEKREKRLQAERVRGLGFNFQSAERNWDMYEKKRHELFSNISRTKEVIGITENDKGDTISTPAKGRLHLPPIKVTQKIVMSK